jgi:hypothetical protein
LRAPRTRWIVGAAALSVTPQLQRAGWTALAVTAMLHAVVLALGDYMRGGQRWSRILRTFLVGAFIVLLLLALVGANTLFNLRVRLGLP